MAEVTLKLVVTRGANLKPDYPLTQQVITIGRSLNNLIVLQDSKVSRYHAEIVKQGNEIEIRDLESANGIRVNGSRVMSKGLEPGDVIQVGEAEFRVDQAVLTSEHESMDDDDEEPDLATLMAAERGSGGDDDPPAFLTGLDLDRDEERMETVGGGKFDSTSVARVPPPPMGAGAKFDLSAVEEEPLTVSKPRGGGSRAPSGVFDRANRPGDYEMTGGNVRSEAPGSTEQVLEHVDTGSSRIGVGGMGYLLSWLGRRAKAVAGGTKGSGLPRPSGIMIVGGPGTGKTLLTQYIASQWGMHFFRLHVPKLLHHHPDRWLEQVSECFTQVNAYLPAILVFEDLDRLASRVEVMGDECKRAYYRVMEIITHWVRNKSSSPFVILTASNPRAVHPDLLRPGGGLDEVFYIDLPPPWERMQILEVQLVTLGKMPSRFDLRSLAEATDGFTGSQLRAGLVEAMFTAQAENREPSTQDIRFVFSRMVPMVHTYGKQFEEIRQWGRLAARYASIPPQGAAPARQPQQPHPPQRAVPQTEGVAVGQGSGPAASSGEAPQALPPGPPPGK